MDYPKLFTNCLSAVYVRLSIMERSIIAANKVAVSMDSQSETTMEGLSSTLHVVLSFTVISTTDLYKDLTILQTTPDLTFMHGGY